MNKQQLTDRFCERLEALPGTASGSEEYRRLYYECMELARSSGYSERAFADMWYNARLWYSATHKIPA